MTGMIEWSQVRLKVKTQKKVCLFKVEKGEIFTALKKIEDYGRAFEVVDLGPDYMRPVRTQTGTTSDRPPYKCLFLFTLGRSEKPSHAGFTHSGCCTDMNDSDRSEVRPRNHVNTNRFEISQKSLFSECV